MKRIFSAIALSAVCLAAVSGCTVSSEQNEIGSDESDTASTDVAASSAALAVGDARLSTLATSSALRTSRPWPPIGPIGPILVLPTPQGDLKLEGVMRYYGGGTPTLGLQINVLNVGDSAVTASSGSIAINGTVLAGALFQYFGGTATTPNTVNPGQHGYIKVEVPTALMVPCNPYSVQIDLGHTMQHGDAAVFANDSGIVTTVCPLGWNTPLAAKHLGHEPAPELAGKKLGDIVSSFVSGRPDGALCSSCHNLNSTLPYHPEVPANAGQTIDPFTNISGNESWACSSNTWASQFIFLPVAKFRHTDALKELVGKWQSDGAVR